MSERSVEFSMINAISFISVRNVDAFASMSSSTPIRVKIRSHKRIFAYLAGTKQLACAKILIIATCFISVLLPLPFGPVTSTLLTIGPTTTSVGENDFSVLRHDASTIGCRPSLIKSIACAPSSMSGRFVCPIAYARPEARRIRRWLRRSYVFIFLHFIN